MSFLGVKIRTPDECVSKMLATCGYCHRVIACGGNIFEYLSSFCGAEGGTRTHTRSPLPVFETGATKHKIISILNIHLLILLLFPLNPVFDNRYVSKMLAGV
jgi:hypothetical protein